MARALSLVQPECFPVRCPFRTISVLVEEVKSPVPVIQAAPEEGEEESMQC